MTFKTKLISSLFLLSLGACGGGDGDSGSGVDGSKALTDLDAAERQDICEYGESLVSEEDSKVLGCYFGALFSSETEEECQTAYDECFAAPEEPSEENCSVDDEPPACAANVTVSELEACAREQADQVASVANSISCASDGSELSELSELPPACKAVQSKCPDLFEDDDQA